MNAEIINANPHYERLGGEKGVRSLVDRFYDLMDEDPDYFGIRKMHPQDLSESRNKLLRIGSINRLFPKIHIYIP